MRDRAAPDEPGLFALADEQLGYFTAQQARGRGYTPSMLTYHVATGRFLRVSRGVYRFSRYPYSPFENVVAAWLRTGKDAVVSHETALYLYNLGDVLPRGVHFIIPRRWRSRRPAPDVKLHTTVVPLHSDERTVHAETGLPVTTPARTITDVADRVPQEELRKAVQDALRSGLSTTDELLASSRGRGARVIRLIREAVHNARHTRGRGKASA